MFRLSWEKVKHFRKGRKGDNKQNNHIMSTKRKREETSPNRSKLAKRSDSQQEPPPPTTDAEVYPAEANVAASARRQILLEALQRIIELQSELDDFENDLDANADYNEDSSWQLRPDHQHQQQQRRGDDEEEEVAAYRRSEAEALGFAMCARETLNFLQREGIPSDSVIYRTLKDKLTGQTDGVIPI